MLADGLERETEFPPSFESTRQRTNAMNPRALELQRHPGAGSFVGSRAVEDDLTGFGDLWRAFE